MCYDRIYRLPHMYHINIEKIVYLLLSDDDGPIEPCTEPPATITPLPLTTVPLLPVVVIEVFVI